MVTMDDMTDLSELFPDMPSDGMDPNLSLDDLPGASINREQGERDVQIRGTGLSGRELRPVP